MPPYKHSRPTFGVLTGWQTYVGTLHTFFEPVFRGIHQAAQDCRVNLLFACGMGRFADDASLRPAWPELAADSDFVPVGPWNTDGLILVTPLISASRSEYIQRLRAAGHPAVFIGAGEAGPVILPDNAAGIRQAAAHLADHGHRRIVYLASGTNGLHAEDILLDDGAYRLRAYLGAIQEYDLEADPRLLVFGRHSLSGGRLAMEQVLLAGIDFTAVLASNDESAIGAIGALKAAGRRVPQDVAVIGFDDRYDAIAQSPPLTTVHYPGFEMGRQALHLLLQKLEGQTPPDQLVQVPVRLVIRETCGCHSGSSLRRTGPAGAQFTPKTAGDQAWAREGSSGFDSTQLAQGMGEEVLAESRYLNPDEIRGLCQQIAQAFETEVRQGHGSVFQLALMSVLEQVRAYGDEVSAWQGAISFLKNNLPLLLESWDGSAAANQAEDLLDLGRVIISESIRQQHSLYRVEQIANTDQMGWMSARLSAAKDEAHIFQILAEEMPNLGLHPARVMFYRPAGDDPVAQGWAPTGLAEAPHYFPSREFPPPQLCSADQLFHWALLPLMLQSERVGCVVFDAADVAAPCGAIVRLLAAAFQSVRLYAADRKHTQDLEQAYSALQENQARLLIAEKMASLGRLTAGIAHEMNTPLAAVRGALAELSERIQEYQQSIGDSAVTAEDHQEIAREMATTVHLAEVAAERAAGFVRGIKSQTRDLGPHERLRFNVAPVIQEALLLLSHALRQSHCIATLEAPVLTLALYGSPGRLSQVVTNLVTNALEASAPRGGGPITLRLSADDQELELRVSDQGGGIPPDTLSKIFDPMFTTKPFGEGTGLGLTIVHDIVVSEFGGRIEVDNHLGVGANFVLHFPLAAAPARDEKR